MKTKIGILVLAFCTTFFNLQAQRTVTTTRATSYDISDNLDLDAVASIFGDSKNLEDFEYRLNDPDNRISNLDLNEDGYIDYLRVLENSSDRNTLVVIQAVLDKDVFQDVATIEIEKVNSGNARVQIVGDAYIYGSNYIIEPIYVRTPLIFSFFWSPRYVTYHSPYYWNYYPRWYSYYRPYPTFKYHRHVHSHINRHNTYHRSNTRNIHFSDDQYNHIRRSDYASRYPNRTFSSRNEGLKNKQELNKRRPISSNHQRNTNVQGSRNERQRDVMQNRRPGSNVQSGTNQTHTRENSNVNSSRKRPESSNAPVQIKSGNRNEGTSVSRNRTNSTSNRQIQPAQPAPGSRNQSVSKPTQDNSPKRVESPQRSSAPREKSGSVSGRSKSEVKQAPQSVRKPEPIKNENKKETENTRRR